MTFRETAYPRVKARRDRSMPSKRKKNRRRLGLRSATPCAAWRRQYCLNPRFQRCNGSPLDDNATNARMLRYDGLDSCRRNVPLSKRWGMTPFKGSKWTPTLHYIRHLSVNVGSPKGRESKGDGAPIVVRGRESRPHGEGGQEIEVF